MSDNLSLYRTIMGLVLKSRVHFHDLRCLVTFVWAIVGLLMEECVHLSQWVVHRPGEVDAASKQRQLMRWLENTKIREAAIYKNLARTALVEWKGEKAYLALDSSSLWGRFVIVRIALIYRGRALPLSWLILEHKSTSVAFGDYKHILKEAAAILPRGCQVVLLADRGFDDEALMRQARDLGWGFRIRLKSSLRIHRASKPSVKVGRLMPAKGHALFLHKIWITDRCLGPVYLALAHAQTPEGYQQWAIVSDDPTDLHTFDEYGLRFDIEENFLDDKSAGFQIESSEIRNAGVLSRLALILATATLYLASTGTAIVHLGQRRLVDTHWNRGLSYFQIGWRWIFHALSNSLPLMPLFWLEPGPDPYPAFASKRQAAQPIAILSNLCTEVT
ncbi:MAG: transposase [Cyanobacteriota bacterium]